MASQFHRARQRRAERKPLMDAGNLNLVPLVDILTSVVFFSLLTYTGAAMAALTAFDLTLPPVVVTADQASAAAPEREQLDLVLAVRIQENSLLVEHSGQGGFRREIAGLDSSSLVEFETLMMQIRQQYASNEDVTVVPDDATSYDDVIQVLERLRNARYSGIALANRARATQVATSASNTTGGR